MYEIVIYLLNHWIEFEQALICRSLWCRAVERTKGGTQLYERWGSGLKGYHFKIFLIWTFQSPANAWQSWSSSIIQYHHPLSLYLGAPQDWSQWSWGRPCGREALEYCWHHIWRMSVNKISARKALTWSSLVVPDSSPNHRFASPWVDPSALTFPV